MDAVFSTDFSFGLVRSGLPGQLGRMVNGELTIFARERLTSLLEQWDRVLGDEPVMQPSYGSAWEWSEDRRRNPVTQGRFVHNFATGWRITGEERWRERGKQALDGLRTGFPIAPCGLPIFGIDDSGAAINDHVCIYGVAFALFGLAHGATLDDDPGIAETAERWWQALLALRDQYGAWPWGLTAEGKSYGSENTHNVIMHLVEATLAWNKIDSRWGGRAEELIAFCTGRLLNSERNAFPEYHDAEWRMISEGESGFYSIGHQWEWAHLLVQANQAGLRGGDLQLARTLAATARRLGMPKRDQVTSRVYIDGSVKADNHFYWDYCEAARACLWLVVHGGAPEYGELLPGLMQSLENRCYDADNRGYASSGIHPVHEQPKGQIWRVDYHQIALFADVIEQINVNHR